MKRLHKIRGFLAGAVLASLAALSACAPTPPPPPPPPVVVIPQRPYPPQGAAPTFQTPPRDINGMRLTVNTNRSLAQTVWNLRSAYNVGALNCLKPEHAAILEGYRLFLTNNSRALSKINRDLEQEFKTLYGPDYIRARESYQTQVYNYFALPPTLPAFCDAVLAMSEQAKMVAPADMDSFAVTSLRQLDAVFGDFFDRFDRYRSDLAAWEARYGSSISLQQQAYSGQSMAQ